MQLRVSGRIGRHLKQRLKDIVQHLLEVLNDTGFLVHVVQPRYLLTTGDEQVPFSEQGAGPLTYP